MPLAVPKWTQDVWDRAFVEYVQAQRDLDRRIAGILRNAATQARTIRDRFEGIDKVSAQFRRLQMESASTLLDQISAEMWPAIEDEVASSLIGASDVALDAQTRMLTKLIEMGVGRTRAGILAESFTGAARAATEHLRSRLINAIPISNDVKRNSKLVSKQLEDALNHGVALGKSARQIAADVVDLINPSTPGGARFAALRIGRTELNNAFHTTTIRAVADQPWVDGVKWVLSDSHPRPDECNAYAQDDHAGLGPGIFTRDSVPGKPHPQCLCYTTVITVEPDQFAEQLLSGRYNRFLVSHGQAPITG